MFEYEIDIITNTKFLFRYMHDRAIELWRFYRSEDEEYPHQNGSNPITRIIPGHYKDSEYIIQVKTNNKDLYKDVQNFTHNY